VRRVIPQSVRVMLVASLTASLGLSAGASIDEPRDEIGDSLQGALEDWGRFVESGDPAVLNGSFAPEGPQFGHLSAETDSGPVRPDHRATTLTLRGYQIVHRRQETATVRAQVEAFRESHASTLHAWRVDLVSRQGAWLVWNVGPVDTSTEKSGLTSGTTTTVERSEGMRFSPLLSSSQEHVAAAPVGEPESRAGTRLPALSAWIIVITILGVATAGYLAPRIDARREQ